MRRFFVLLTVFVIVASLALPAFAASGGSSFVLKSSGAPFDYVIPMLNGNVRGIVEWPGNFVQEGGNEVVTEFKSGNDVIFASIGSHHNSSLQNLSTVFYCPGANGFMFHTERAYFHKNWNFDLIADNDQSSLRITGFTVSGRVVRLTKDAAGFAREVSMRFEKSYSNGDQPVREFDGTAVIRHWLEEFTALNPSYSDVASDSVVRIDDLRFKINFYWEPDAVDRGFRVTTKVADINSISQQWFSDQHLNLKEAIEPSVLSDFLSSTVMGFLDFELFPGVSFGGLISVFVTVGFVLWFIKVVR